ncbi:MULTISPECIES: ASCH domain-containing protein [unclassified Actinomyces]|uniref:ASCH domain-containing protein n=1 Tax=unclassified Actinomyces TaxID=2609248 RepID=UPI002017ADF9|nr:MULTISPECIES: ASCH domain-containing protein [unclassified Actinomyces]MCL3776626.1 ASCH domain-containing protein [Actinomyces sp. AC-20-1]MCL3790272.1 ASCH domain-containing protein [Actinomyces sp. 187325]MCL3791905.1 ASCH domain-containing protein [Actinomyces sp. 186855]MCL3795074.1 ASCH domain-containing protein [Actinomyces sp. 217892]
MISEDLRDLVGRVAEHARRWDDGEDHTVAAGLLTASGAVVLGVNTYHFLGGPCAEVAALSNHASSRPDDPVVAVVAARGPSGAVIPPCGKCRQVMFDLDPGIRFVVREPSGLTTRTAAELLPFAYDWHAVKEPQTVYMWEGYEHLVRSGAKTQTIRVDDPFFPGPARIVFEKDDGEVVALPATVTEVLPLGRDELTEEIAQRDGFAGLAELHEALDRHYPGLAADGRVDVVRFVLGSAEPGPGERPDAALGSREV